MIGATHHLDILARVLRPGEASFSKELAEFLLTLDFTDQERAKIQQLAVKSNDGTLSRAERADYDWLVTLGEVITLLHLKARNSLGRYQPAA